MRVDDLEAFLAVARRRGFRAAASDLGVSRSALSHNVAGLEARLGVRLFHRTTRSVSLTDAGQQLAEALRGPVGMIRDAMALAGAESDHPHGTLRLNMAVTAARQLANFFTRYGEQCPDVVLDVSTEDAVIDIVKYGFDAGIRIRELVPLDMIAIPIGGLQKMAVVGSPEYLSIFPAPKYPPDLMAHRCIRGRLANGIWPWEFRKGEETVVLDVPGRLILADTAAMVAAALHGAGLAYVGTWAVREHVAAHSLVSLLEDWMPTYSPLCLYYSGHRLVPAGLRAMAAMAREDRDTGK